MITLCNRATTAEAKINLVGETRFSWGSIFGDNKDCTILVHTFIADQKGNCCEIFKKKKKKKKAALTKTKLCWPNSRAYLEESPFWLLDLGRRSFLRRGTPSSQTNRNRCKYQNILQYTCKSGRNFVGKWQRSPKTFPSFRFRRPRPQFQETHTDWTKAHHSWIRVFFPKRLFFSSRLTLALCTSAESISRWPTPYCSTCRDVTHTHIYARRQWGCSHGEEQQQKQQIGTDPNFLHCVLRDKLSWEVSTLTCLTKIFK